MNKQEKETPASADQAWTDAAEQQDERKPVEQWERDLISKISFTALTEHRRSRRWGIFFKLLTATYIGFFIYMVYTPGDDGSGLNASSDHTALVEINGVIASDAAASADTIITGLRAAFKNTNSVGIILRINSPGGSPVQAGYVNDEIKRLKERYPEKKVYAVISDVCASGGYYIAAAADDIYADKASLVGSIGVLMDGFGFVDTMKLVGVERRLLTSGEQKGFLDPFSPLKPADAAHMKEVLASTHQQFIKVVKEGRGDRLVNDPKLFSGLIWTGEQSLDLGLIDGLGSSSYVAREVIGAKKIVNYTLKPNPLERFAEKIGASFAGVMSTKLGLDGLELR